MAVSRVVRPAAQAIYVGPSPSTGAHFSSGNSGVNLVKQLLRVQSYNADWSRDQQDILQLGDYGAFDRISANLPTVNFSVNYLLTNLRNESGIGFNVSGNSSCLKDFFNAAQEDKNYFVKVVPVGESAINNTGNGAVISIGNAFLNSYRASASVGGFAQAEFTAQGLDFVGSAVSTGFDTPAINPANGQPISSYIVTLPSAVSGVDNQVSVLLPGQITLDLDGAGVGITDLCVQSFDLGIDMNRQPNQCMGSPYPDSYELQLPINASFSVQANAKSFATGRLSNSNCAGEKFDLVATLRQRTCDASLGAIKVQYTLSGATLDSQSYSVDVNGVEQTTLSFSCPINGPTTVTPNCYMSGSIN